MFYFAAFHKGLCNILVTMSYNGQHYTLCCIVLCSVDKLPDFAAIGVRASPQDSGKAIIFRAKPAAKMEIYTVSQKNVHLFVLGITQSKIGRF